MRRTPLLILAAAFAIAALCALWPREGIAIGAAPDPAAAYGTWIPDQDAIAALERRMDALPSDPADGAMRSRREAFRRFARDCRDRVLVLAADACGIGSLAKPPVPVACAWAATPPDRLVATPGDAAATWRIELSLDPAHPGELRWLAAPEIALPLRRR